MKFLAMVSMRGTACNETCLCETCHKGDENRVLAVRQAHTDVDIAKGFIDVTANEMACCVICHANHPQHPRDGLTRLLDDVNRVPTQRRSQRD